MCEFVEAVSTAPKPMTCRIDVAAFAPVANLICHAPPPALRVNRPLVPTVTLGQLLLTAGEVVAPRSYAGPYVAMSNPSVGSALRAAFAPAVPYMMNCSPPTSWTTILLLTHSPLQPRPVAASSARSTSPTMEPAPEPRVYHPPFRVATYGVPPIETSIRSLSPVVMPTNGPCSPRPARTAAARSLAE